MSNKNRLLDMLNAATSPPSAPSAHPNTTQSSALLSPPSGSTREPSPAPPPPSLQAVSLSDLFAGLTTPSAPQDGHSAGMSSMSKGEESSLPHSNTLSAVGEGLNPGLSSSPTSGKPGQSQPDHKANLLKMFKSPQNGNVQPTIAISADSSAPSTGSAIPSPSRSADPPHTASNGSKPDAESYATASKSMFDFVSPFDVFEKPKPKPKVTEKTHIEIEAAKANISKPDSPALSNATAPSVPARAETGERHLSGAGPQGSSRDLGLPWLASKLIPKGTEGKGPKSTGPHVTVDITKLGIDSLVNVPGAVQIVPTTILKKEHIAFQRGRSVGITPTWLAYALSKGRVRLIESASGARLVLQIPSSPVGDIIDVAVISDAVAVIGADRSVTIFEVPERWEFDDPPCRIVAHIAPSPEADIGEVNRVEWLRKEDSHHLIIGGSAGVIVVKLTTIADERALTVANLESRLKVLKTEGPLASFCLNYSQQAIGLLSTKGHFTLYNVSNLNRVWNRPLPSTGSAPSSVHFVEANILVGRDNDTQFDLVQITVDVAVISTIKFTSPSPAAHFAQVVYDSPRNMLWIAPFARGSLFALRYALKGVPPARGSVVAFDRIAEYPLEPVLSLALNPKSEDAELFFASPTGFSLARIEKAQCDALSSTRQAEPSNLPQTNPSKKPSPAIVKSELPEVDVSKGGLEDILKLLKKSEDKIANGVKQTLTNQLGQINTRLNILGSEDLAVQMEKTVEIGVANALQEVKTILPSVVKSAVQSEVSALQSTVSAAITSSLQTVTSAIEKSLVSTVQRVVTGAVEHSVERSLQNAVQSTLLPAIQSANERVVEQLTAEFKSEALRMSKDLAPQQGSDIKALASTINDLQKQVSMLAEQLSRQSAPPPLPILPPVSLAQHPHPPPMPPAHVLEDTFLTGLGEQSTAATLNLVNDHWIMTQGLLPTPPGKSPLSHAIILTLLHRLALALTELNPADPSFTRVLDWEERVAMSIDHRSPDIAAFYGRVVPIVQAALGNILQSLGRGGAPFEVEAAKGVRQILETLANKP